MQKMRASSGSLGLIYDTVSGPCVTREADFLSRLRLGTSLKREFDDAAEPAERHRLRCFLGSTLHQARWLHAAPGREHTRIGKSPISLLLPLRQ